MSQPGTLQDSPRPAAAHMIRPAARHAIPLLMLAAAACYDRPNAALSSDKAVRNTSADSTHHVVAPGVTAVTAEAAAKKGHELKLCRQWTPEEARRQARRAAEARWGRRDESAPQEASCR